jgi:membrane associated rhomboid family serine protease
MDRLLLNGLRRGGARRGGGQVNPMALLLLARVLQQVHALPVKPPVTLGLMALQAWVFLANPLRVRGLHQVCLSAHEVLRFGEPWRVLVAPLVHASDYHLAYNLSSFLYKGVLMEQRVGSARFAALLLALALAAGLIFLAAALLAGRPDECVVGFSAVIFALKVLVNYDLEDPDAQSSLFGLRLPSRHVVWAELLLVQLLMPHSSWLAHASGVAAGFLVLALRDLRLASGRGLFDWLPREPATYGRGTWGAAPEPRAEAHPRRPQQQQGAQYQQQQHPPTTARQPASQTDSGQPAQTDSGQPAPRDSGGSGGAYSLSAEELRQRRIDRFSTAR